MKAWRVEMQTVTISYARTHRSRLVRVISKGETFIITKAGKPLAIFEAVRDKPSESIPLQS